MRLKTLLICLIVLFLNIGTWKLSEHHYSNDKQWIDPVGINNGKTFTNVIVPIGREYAYVNCTFDHVTFFILGDRPAEFYGNTIKNTIGVIASAPVVLAFLDENILDPNLLESTPSQEEPSPQPTPEPDKSIHDLDFLYWK